MVEHISGSGSSDRIERLVIYGTGTFGAQMAWELAHSSSADFLDLRVCADGEYVNSEWFSYGEHWSADKLRYHDFNEIEEHCSPENFHMTVVFGGNDMMAREAAFRSADAKGYRFASYIHPSSVCRGLQPTETEWIGESPTGIGRNFIVYANCTVDHGATIGDNVMVRPNCYIGHDSHVGDHTFLAPGCNLAGRSTIGERCFIGMGANIAGVRVEDRTVVGTGAAAVRDCSPSGVYVGVPAKLKAGYRSE